MFIYYTMSHKLNVIIIFKLNIQSDLRLKISRCLAVSLASKLYILIVRSFNLG